MTKNIDPKKKYVMRSDNLRYTVSNVTAYHSGLYAASTIHEIKQLRIG